MAVTETRDGLATNNQVFERTTDSLKVQLHEEVTTRKLAEQRVESLVSDIEKLKTAKVRSSPSSTSVMGTLQGR